jgi:long-subunit fatty acid transport protein
MSSQVPYRLGDGAPVTIDSARAIWTAVAREVLAEASTTAPVTHSELARQVQQRSGVSTRMPAAEWLPAVLAELGDADLAARLGPDAPQRATRAKTTSSRPRSAPATSKRQEAPPAICPTCFMQLPANGRCDTCT